MSEAAFYPVGTPGQPWGAAERELWRGRQQRHHAGKGFGPPHVVGVEHSHVFAARVAQG